MRDFRDMVCSIRSFNENRGREGFCAGGSGGDEAYVREVLAPSVARRLEEWRARSDRAHLVRYEDLSDDPRSAVPDMLAFAGLDDTPALVDSILGEAGQEIPGMADHRTAASSRASVGRWREELPREVAQLCEQAFGPALEEFGYIR